MRNFFILFLCTSFFVGNFFGCKIESSEISPPSVDGRNPTGQNSEAKHPFVDSIASRLRDDFESVVITDEGEDRLSILVRVSKENLLPENFVKVSQIFHLAISDVLGLHVGVARIWRHPCGHFSLKTSVLMSPFLIQKRSKLDLSDLSPFLIKRPKMT